MIAPCDPRRAELRELLVEYLTAAGGVRTYPSPELYGSWADEHDEVAPAAGLAHLVSGDRSTADRIRARVLDRYRANGRWLPFWWGSDAYVSAHNLTFLARSDGGIPPAVAAAERQRLDRSVGPVGSDHYPGEQSYFDVAHRLMAAVHLQASEHIGALCRKLLAAQLPDGGWPASPGLLVPGRYGRPTRMYTDVRRLLTTSVSVLAVVDTVTTSTSDGCVPPFIDKFLEGPAESGSGEQRRV